MWAGRPGHRGRASVTLPRSFYARDAATVARDLLGTVLVMAGADTTRRGRIVETEAYLGEHDLAAHASKGRTKRTAVLYGPPATAYVYLIYGMYDMFNVVVSRENDPQAVLVRAVEPLDGVAGRTDGPGRLTRAFGIGREHNGISLLGPPLTLRAGAPPDEVEVTPRIGVDYAREWAEAPLRFAVAGSRWVSKRPSRRARKRG